MSEDYIGGEYKFSRDEQRQLDKHRSERNASASGDKEARKSIKNWTPFNHNKRDGAGKGDKERPKTIGREEYGLKYDLATGEITREEFDKAMEDLHGN